MNDPNMFRHLEAIFEKGKKGPIKKKKDKVEKAKEVTPQPETIVKPSSPKAEPTPVETNEDQDENEDGSDDVSKREKYIVDMSERP